MCYVFRFANKSYMDARCHDFFISCHLPSRLEVLRGSMGSATDPLTPVTATKGSTLVAFPLAAKDSSGDLSHGEERKRCFGLAEASQKGQEAIPRHTSQLVPAGPSPY